MGAPAKYETEYRRHVAAPRPWNALAAAVYFQALRDLKHPNPRERLDALFWLWSPAARLTLDALDMEAAQPAELLADFGRMKRMLRSNHTNHSHKRNHE